MTPKEKAEELFDKFNNPDIKHYPYIHNAQQCALIAVDEIIKANPYEVSKTDMDSTIDYWQEVKQELEKL
jgi:hypothetical protein